MSNLTVTKTFTISASPDVMRRFERFLAFFHYNGGHSGIFGMPFDGDGSDRMRIEPPPPLLVDENNYSEVGKIGGTGLELEIANDNGYSALAIDRGRNYYRTKNGKLYRKTPSGDVFVKDTNTFEWNPTDEVL